VILPDVNALLYAFVRESPNHDRWYAWLDRLLLNRDEELALPDHCAIGFLRVATNPRAVERPATAADALAFVDRIRGARTTPIRSTARTWEVLRTMTAADRQIRANLVPDAYLAALAISHGCRLATADRGFGRFPGLDVFDPTV
jgi:toxin-antitoxin system PIN domain toxin